VEIGATPQLKIMLQLTATEADFLMHCMEVFAEGDEKVTFISADGKLALANQQIEALFQRIQDVRSHAIDMEYEQRMAMAD